MDYYNKHYIRVDKNNHIVKGFSDAFEQPTETYICINLEGGRHFELNGQLNPPLTDMQGVHLFKYVDGVVVETTREEREAEQTSFPAPPETQEEAQARYNIDLDYRLSKLELGV